MNSSRKIENADSELPFFSGNIVWTLWAFNRQITNKKDETNTKQT
jgi:hypothetical protein